MTDGGYFSAATRRSLPGAAAHRSAAPPAAPPPPPAPAPAARRARARARSKRASWKSGSRVSARSRSGTASSGRPCLGEQDAPVGDHHRVAGLDAVGRRASACAARVESPRRRQASGQPQVRRRRTARRRRSPRAKCGVASRQRFDSARTYAEPQVRLRIAGVLGEDRRAASRSSAGTGSSPEVTCAMRAASSRRSFGSARVAAGARRPRADVAERLQPRGRLGSTAGGRQRRRRDALDRGGAAARDTSRRLGGQVARLAGIGGQVVELGPRRGDVLAARRRAGRRSGLQPKSSSGANDSA